MIPTLSIIEAIATTFQGNGLMVAAFPTWQSNGQTMFSFYQDLAPEAAPLPFMVYNVVSAPTNTVYGRVAFTEPTIRFTAYDADSVSVMRKMNIFINMLDDKQLALPEGANQLFTNRLGDPLPSLDERTTDGTGREIWSADVVYHFAAQ